MYVFLVSISYSEFEGLIKVTLLKAKLKIRIFVYQGGFQSKIKKVEEKN